MLLFSQCLLCDRGQTGAIEIIWNPREYADALVVDERALVAGETVTRAGLRHLGGLPLVELTQNVSSIIPTVDPDTELKESDILLFTGAVEKLTILYHFLSLQLVSHTE